ncbi:MAG: BamA/TamA family outer membrane protein [Salibacteraceae bacterium]
MATNQVITTDTLEVEGYSFVYSQSPRFRPEVILKAVFLREGERYSLTNHQLTNRRLAELRTFKFINIRYERVGENQLDCIIRLTPSPRQAVTLEAEGTNQQGNLGIAGSAIYLNKNSFKGAEALEFRLKGGLEAQQIANDDEPLPEDDANTDEGTVERTVEEFTPFNTIEIGSEIKLAIPDLFLAKRYLTKLAYTQPRTEINVVYNFQNRPTFSRTIAEINYGWKLNYKDFHSFSIYPVDISLIQISADDDFRALLDALNNSQLSASYNDHFIPAGRFQYTYNNYNPNKPRSNTWYLRPRLELAGFSLYQAFRLAGAETEDGSYRIDNIRFANYFKVDLEVKRKVSFTRTTEFVYRTFTGLGNPVDNLDVLPFEKSYFGGGANFMRAWRARSLGPGALPDTLRTGIDKIGEVQLEGNIEYRFDIIELLEGAAFVDIGNIWNLNENPDLPGAEIRSDRFYNELAIGTGLGVRFDFSFFILRIDGAIQMKDPSFPRGERWVFQSKDQLNAMRNERGFAPYQFPQGSINLGIGYPF